MFLERSVFIGFPFCHFFLGFFGWVGFVEIIYVRWNVVLIGSLVFVHGWSLGTTFIDLVSMLLVWVFESSGLDGFYLVFEYC